MAPWEKCLLLSTPSVATCSAYQGQALRVQAALTHLRATLAGCGQQQPQGNNNMNTRTEVYAVQLSPVLVNTIKNVIEMEKKLLHIDPCSRQWFALQGELSEYLEEIGFMLTWEFKQLPF